jgi:hypothetical protein
MSIMSDTNPIQETVFACDIHALTLEQREHHGEASKLLFADVAEVRETASGFEFRLSADSTTLVRVANFIMYERLCCPFFTFSVEVEPRNGPIWIGLAGDEAIKPFVIAELGWMLKDDIATAAGFR